MRVKAIINALLLVFCLTGCTMAISTNRHEVRPSEGGVSRVAVDIHDSNLGGGGEAYVNASIASQLKAAMPAGTLVANGEDLTITVQLLSAHKLYRWYSYLTLGLLRQYYQLGSIRVVNQKTGKILAIHDILLTGRRILPMTLEEYQTLVLPQVVNLLKDEISRNGLAIQGQPIEIDVGDV